MSINKSIISKGHPFFISAKYCCFMALLLVIFSSVAMGQSEDRSLGGTKESGQSNFPLGPLGGMAKVVIGKPDLVVSAIDEGGPAHRAGLRLGDIIVGVNGHHFKPTTNDINDGGQGPLEGLGYSIDSAEGSKDGKLTLDVKRNSKKIKIKVKVPTVGSFNRSYPLNCDKSRYFYNGMCKFLAENQQSNGSWHSKYGGGARAVLTSLAGLALTGHENPQFHDHAKRAAQYIMKNVKPDSAGNWALAYGGIFLSEYYLRSHDPLAKKVITAYVKELVKRQGDGETTDDRGQWKLGSFGHGKGGFYGGGGLNIVATTVLWFWALAEKCEVEVPQESWDLTTQYVLACTRRGAVMYSLGMGSFSDASGRTGNMAMALVIAGKNINDAKIMAQYMTQNTKRAREAHAFSAPGMLSSTMALKRLDPQGYRKHMEYWKWYFTLCRTPDFRASYLGSKRNNGGDEYLNPDMIMNACIGIIFAAQSDQLYSYNAGKTKDKKPRRTATGHKLIGNQKPLITRTKPKALAGYEFDKLSPSMQVSYRLIEKKKYNSAIARLNAMTRQANLDDKDRQAARQMLDALYSKQITPMFDQIQKAYETGDMRYAEFQLKRFVEIYSIPLKYRAEIIAIRKSLKQPENQQLIQLGKKFEDIVTVVESNPDMGKKMLQKFASQYKQTAYGKRAAKKLLDMQGAGSTNDEQS